VVGGQPLGRTSDPEGGIRMVDRPQRHVAVPDDLRGHYLPGHRFWTEGADTNPQVRLHCRCGFDTAGLGLDCIEAGAQHCRQVLVTTKVFRREIILRFGSAIAVWSYDPEPGSWVATASLATVLAELCQEWAHEEQLRRMPTTDEH
jgi:hypothetical protein